MMDEGEGLERKAQFEKQKRVVWILSLAGLIPFVLPALLVLILGMSNPLSAPLMEIFRTYSVVILSFLGGLRWGHALLRENDETSSIDWMTICLSVVPSLIAWATLFLDMNLALAILLLAFCAQGAWDSFSAQFGKLPKWFITVRMLLTVIVAICHGIMIIAVG